MKTTKFTAAIVMVAIAVTGTSVVAKSTDRGERMSFEQFDQDGDGQITRAEMEEFRSARFAEMDTNGDGFISTDELTAQSVKRAGDRAAKMMERLDTDGDGLLSEEDLAQAPRAGRMFDRLDQNQDGVVTKAEFDEARERFGKRKGVKSQSE